MKRKSVLIFLVFLALLASQAGISSLSIGLVDGAAVEEFGGQQAFPT